jgi:hypothetical protein
MTTQSDLEEKIKSVMQPTEFIDPQYVATDHDITEIVRQLGFAIPKSLVWFLKTFGAGGINGVDLFGTGVPEHKYVIVNETKELIREHPKLSGKRWILLETSEMGWVFVIDVAGADVDLMDAPINAYNIFTGNFEKVWNGFYDYLAERFGFTDPKPSDSI